MMRFGDTAKITASLIEFNGVKMHVKYRIENAATGELCCLAESRHCFMYNGKIVNIKRKFPEIYGRFTAHIGVDSDKFED
jgi:acyl-CoA thioester hydrolase